jgi:hypothetical protein
MNREHQFPGLGGRFRPQIKSTTRRLLIGISAVVGATARTRRKGGVMSTQQNVSRCPILAMMLAAAVTALTIGLAPPAAAKGVVLPRGTCSGPHIAAKTCTKPPQPVPAHVCCGNHGSRHRKIAIAIAREARRGSPEERTNSIGDGQPAPTSAEPSQPDQSKETPMRALTPLQEQTMNREHNSLVRQDNTSPQ